MHRTRTKEVLERSRIGEPPVEPSRRAERAGVDECRAGRDWTRRVARISVVAVAKEVSLF